MIFSSEAEGRYLEAVARRDAIAEAWRAEGEPLLATGSTGQLVEHPFLRMLRDHDYSLIVGGEDEASKMGRPPSAVPGIPPPLKRVK